jgi:5-oxoprolinase (ATP-hydrolysing) subunit A
MDLNADLGEGSGNDQELLAVVTSANVACGAHAGSVDVMRDTVRRARDAGVTIGAHPGYPDREGFGRREIDARPAEIERWVREQIEALLTICRAEGVTLRYVKPHGALYNRAVHDIAAAAAIADAVRTVDRTLMLLALPGSAMLAAARVEGLGTAREAFLDRGYLADGSLAPRETPGALLTDPRIAADRAMQLAQGRPISDIDGKPLRVEADSLCVHGDSLTALAMARAARERLAADGITLAPFA